MEYTLGQLNEMMEKNRGNLNLSCTEITALPEGLIVGGNLDLSDTPITALPDGLTVGGDLDLSYTRIVSLPDDLTVGGALSLFNAQIASLPKGLAIGGWLSLSNTRITSLPEGLTVGDYLDLRDSQIVALPEGLKVGGDLHLERTQITALPDDLTVGGILILRGTVITKLPNSLNVEWIVMERELFLSELNDILDNCTARDLYNMTFHGSKYIEKEDKEECLNYKNYKEIKDRLSFDDNNLRVKNKKNIKVSSQAEVAKQEIYKYIDLLTESPRVRQAAKDWVEMRTMRNKNDLPTQRAVSIVFNKLREWRYDENKAVKAFEQSIECGWKGIFSLKD